MSRPAKPPGHLAPYERRVIAELAKGSTNKEIAAILGVTPDTMKVYVSHLYTKLGLSGYALNSRVFVALHAAEILAGAPTRVLLEAHADSKIPAPIREYLAAQDHGLCPVRQNHAAQCACGLNEARAAAGLGPRPIG